MLADWQITREEELRLLPREEYLERRWKELEPLDDHLKAAGLETGSLFCKVNPRDQPQGYSFAVPLILEYLKNPLTDRAKAAAASLLCEKVPEVRNHWSEIVTLYKAEPNYYEVVREGKVCRQKLLAKDILANALIASFTPKRLTELLELVKDRSNGGSRIILLHILLRRKGHNIDAFLFEMLHDPELFTELSSWKRLSERPKVS